MNIRRHVPALLCVSAAIAGPAGEPSLKPGAPVHWASLAAAEWIQGDPPKDGEPGKVYIIECWATWCGPCLASIPHLNALHVKYHAKGLRIVGVNVLEDGVGQVREFVRQRGEGMSYPVAYTGKGSAFEKEWLGAAGVSGIPHAFVVRDGHLILMSHPANLSDEVIESLLAGGEDPAPAQAALAAAVAARGRAAEQVGAFRQAAQQGDVGAMSVRLAELEALDPGNSFIGGMRLDVMMARKDWDGLRRMLGEPSKVGAGPIPVLAIAHRISRGSAPDCPESFTREVAEALARFLDRKEIPADPMDRITLAWLWWAVGRKDDARACARRAAEQAREGSARGTPPAPFERFDRAVEEGAPPSVSEFYDWINAAAPQRGG